jgi:hypothetical protein
MNDVRSTERIILKILSGIQAGAEVSLTLGEYTLGSGPDDDIQFIDVSLMAGHARLRVSPGKIELAGGSGPLATANGLRVEAGASDWHEVEPLDIITAGTMRFALGPPTANWTTLTEDLSRAGADASAGKRGPAAKTDAPFPATARRVAVPVLMLLAIVGIALWHFSFGGERRIGRNVGEQRSDLEIVRAALDQFPFGRAITLKQEVDGTIYTTGFVESVVERRALIGAVEKAAVPVRFRVGVLQSLRNEIDNLIKAEKVAVSFTLTPAGDLSLEGVILDEDAARSFVDRIRGLVIGLNQIDSKIRTAKRLLAEIEKLSRMSQIDSLVVFRLDGELIEANGVLPVDKIDSWVGFLQSYARRFGKDIGLRSFVQLQAAESQQASNGPDGAILLGGKNAGPKDALLDVERLARGQFELSDIFAGIGKQASPAAASDAAESGGSVLTVADRVGGPALAPKGSEPGSQSSRFDPGLLVRRTNDLVLGWRDGKLKTGSGDQALDAAMAAVAAARAGLDGQEGNEPRAAEKYLPLLPNDLDRISVDTVTCRPSSRLTPATLPLALFWLDLLSVSETLLITSFAREEQGFLLEAALNPRLAAACAGRMRSKDAAPVPSLYLSEATRNPAFVRYVARNLPPFALDVSGASIAGTRFVQTREGLKMNEGAAPDGSSRIAVVGELGAAIQVKDGYAAVIYGPDINWLNQK